MEIGKVFTNHFRSFFGSKNDSHFLFDWSFLLRNKNLPDLSFLEAPFSKEEIKCVIFEMGTDKAPRPDGFPISFFQKFWPIVERDILKLCLDFQEGVVKLEKLNWANIVLIPKVDAPEGPADFRPISLINTSFKILTKILATRLSKIIDLLVERQQSAFIKGRCIMDNIFAAEELIFSRQKRRLQGYILKVDFAKVFDMVDWDFLVELLVAFGFRGKWISWIKTLLHSRKANFIINGEQKGYVRNLRGLRQEDPLSPLIFVLVTDVLGLMFNQFWIRVYWLVSP